MHHFADTVVSIAEHYGLPIVFISLLLDSFGFPSPGESLLVAMSAVAANGGVSFWGLFIVSVLAAVIGDNVGYAIGRFGGRKLVVKYGHRIGINDERLGKVERIYKNYGAVIIILSRFIIPARQLNGVVAGIVHMNFWRFQAYNVTGALLWIGFWLFAVSAVFARLKSIENFFVAGHYLALAAGLIVLAVAIAGVWYWRKHHNASAATDPPAAIDKTDV